MFTTAVWCRAFVLFLCWKQSKFSSVIDQSSISLKFNGVYQNIIGGIEYADAGPEVRQLYRDPVYIIDRSKLQTSRILKI